VDLREERAQLAAELGLRFARPEEARGEVDLVVHASGSEAGLRRALELAGQDARIVELSWFGDREPSLPLGQAFHPRRLSIVSSQVGRLPGHQQARWDYARRLNLALRLLEDDRLDALISGECGFEELPEKIGAILADPDTLCHRIRYSRG
jgi:threonine dehydrogenase-like Zn-dependent dehydrogenase